MSSIKGQVRLIKSTDDQVRWGGNNDPYKAGMQDGVIYDVIDIEIHSLHTKIRLHGYEGQFNSASFEWLDETALDEAFAAWRKQ